MNLSNILVVNCSTPHWNLATHKLTDRLRDGGHTVTHSDGDPGLFAPAHVDAVYLSVIFSWHAPLARDIALRFRDREVHCGGPGMTALAKWWAAETGLACHVGLDQTFERQRGTYRMTFASRGCPVNCWFCIVPKIEGKTFTLDWDFQPAPILCDNNLSALPEAFQDHIIGRYVDSGVRLGDANSGFEPHTFTQETYQRWKPILRGPWRFALDEMRELEDVQRMMVTLRDESPKRKRVYVLIGNEPIEACHERALKVIEWGGEPFCQPLLPLNALDREDFSIRHDWTARKLKDFARYFNRYLWRYFSLADYEQRGERLFEELGMTTDEHSAGRL